MLSRVTQWSAACGCALSALLVFGVPGRQAAAQGPPPIGQRRINEMAAALLRAHRALIEEPALRRDGERLEDYTARVAAPLPGETPVHYRAREESFVAALDRAADDENLCRAVPALRDTSASNKKLWNQAVHESSFLPGRAARVRAAWAACRPMNPDPALARRFGAEMAQTLLTIKAACDALREARP